MVLGAACLYITDMAPDSGQYSKYAIIVFFSLVLLARLSLQDKFTLWELLQDNTGVEL